MIPVSSACMRNLPERMSATRRPAKFSSTPRSMARNSSMLSNTPFTEDTSSATVADVTAGGISARLSRNRLVGRAASPAVFVADLAAIAARAADSVCGDPSSSASSSPSPSLASSPSLHTRAWLPTPEEKSSASRLSRTVRTASSSSPGVAGDTIDDETVAARASDVVVDFVVVECDVAEGFVSSASANDAGPSGRCARIHRAVSACESGCSAAADVGLKDVITPPGGATRFSGRAPSDPPSSPSIAPRFAAAFALSRRHGADGDGAEPSDVRRWRREEASETASLSRVAARRSRRNLRRWLAASRWSTLGGSGDRSGEVTRARSR